MLRHVRSLADFAVIEVSQHGLALDEDSRISKLEIAFLLQTTDSALCPVSAPLMRVAGRVQRLFERLRSGICGYSHDISHIRASLRVLNVVSDEAQRKALMPRVDVDPGQVIKQRKLRAELGIRHRRNSRWIRGAVDRNDRARSGGVERVLHRAAGIQRKESAQRSL